MTNLTWHVKANEYGAEVRVMLGGKFVDVGVRADYLARYSAPQEMEQVLSREMDAMGYTGEMSTRDAAASIVCQMRAIAGLEPGARMLS